MHINRWVIEEEIRGPARMLRVIGVDEIIDQAGDVRESSARIRSGHIERRGRGQAHRGSHHSRAVTTRSHKTFSSRRAVPRGGSA